MKHGAEEALVGLIRAHVRCVLDEVDGASAHVAVDALPPELRRKIASKRDRYERAVRKLVADGVEAGEFRACDPVLVARALLGALNWTVQWYRPGGRTSPARVADEYAECLVRGLVSQGASPRPPRPRSKAARAHPQRAEGSSTPK